MGFHVSGRRLPAGLVIVLVAALGISLLLVSRNLGRAYQRAKQVQTFADMQVVRGRLEEYRAAHRAYPQDLASVLPGKDAGLGVDAWGNALFFASGGQSYVLASLGRDGAAEVVDYGRSGEGLSPPLSVAGSWDRDQVATEEGWKQQAGK